MSIYRSACLYIYLEVFLLKQLLIKISRKSIYFLLLFWYWSFGILRANVHSLSQRHTEKMKETWMSKLTCIQNSRVVTKSSDWNSWSLLSVIHFTRKEPGIPSSSLLTNCFTLGRKVCCKKTFTLLRQEGHKIASKNLAQERQLPRHPLNSAFDFSCAVFLQMLRQVRHFYLQ